MARAALLPAAARAETVHLARRCVVLHPLPPRSAPERSARPGSTLHRATAGNAPLPGGRPVFLPDGDRGAPPLAARAETVHFADRRFALHAPPPFVRVVRSDSSVSTRSPTVARRRPRPRPVLPPDGESSAPARRDPRGDRPTPPAALRPPRPPAESGSPSRRARSGPLRFIEPPTGMRRRPRAASGLPTVTAATRSPRRGPRRPTSPGRASASTIRCRVGFPGGGRGPALVCPPGRRRGDALRRSTDPGPPARW